MSGPCEFLCSKSYLKSLAPLDCLAEDLPLTSLTARLPSDLRFLGLSWSLEVFRNTLGADFGEIRSGRATKDDTDPFCKRGLNGRPLGFNLTKAAVLPASHRRVVGGRFRLPTTLLAGREELLRRHRGLSVSHK